MTEVEFAVEDPATGDAARLLEAMVHELTGMYGRMDGGGKPGASPLDLSPPGGAYVVGRVEGVAVAGGGFKRLDAATAEIKRMYVVPAWRGRALSRRLLATLEAEAARSGYRRVRLDTGPLQTVAVGLYERTGYRPIEDYNANPDASYWGEKDL